MKLEQSFTVTAPVEQVWAMLIDVERVAPCLPGAEITGQSPDGAYEGTFSVKLGPATAAYNGSLRMESVDEASHTATMSAKGTDKRGQGGANATIVSTMREEGGETTVDVATDFTITGRLARFGRGGMIEDISKRLMRDFAQCLQATLAAEQDAGLAPVAAPDAATVYEEEAAAEAAGGAPDAPAAEAPPAEPTAAEAAAASPLPGQEAADEPLQPAQAPWPPRAPEPEPPAASDAAASEAAASEAAGEPVASDAAGEPAPPADAPLPEAAAADVAPAEAASDAPAAAEPPPPAAAEPLAPAEPPPPPAAEPASAESDAPAEQTTPAEQTAAGAAAPKQTRSGSIPPPTAAARPAAQPAKPISGFSLFFGVLWDRIKRFFGRLFGRKRES
jgi:uncharacterized protein